MLPYQNGINVVCWVEETTSANSCTNVYANTTKPTKIYLWLCFLAEHACLGHLPPTGFLPDYEG
jgi:hypothetical protein